MIVRILGEGQFELDNAEASRLDPLDAALDAALASEDELAFESALSTIVSAVRELGEPLAPHHIVPSDLVLPPEGASLDEVRQLLNSENAEA